MTELKETSLLDAVQDSKQPKAKVTPRKAASTPVSSFNKTAVRKSLVGLYEAAGLAVMPFDPQCASVFGDDEFVNGAVDSWLELADTNPLMRKWLTKLTQTTGWGKVIMAHLPLIMAVASHHTNFGSQMAMFAAGKVGQDDRRETNSDY